MDYRQLVDLSPDGIFVSRDSSIVYVNPAGLRLFGAATPDQVIGQSPLRFFHPDRHTEIRERVRLLLQNCGTKGPIVARLRMDLNPFAGYYREDDRCVLPPAYGRS